MGHYFLDILYNTKMFCAMVMVSNMSMGNTERHMGNFSNNGYFLLQLPSTAETIIC